MIKDKEFNKANRVYEEQCEELKIQRLAETEHKLPIVTELNKSIIKATFQLFQGVAKPL